MPTPPLERSEALTRLNPTMTLALTLLLASQAVDGIKPIIDGTLNYAKAYVGQVSANPEMAQKPDPFAAGFWTQRAKVMAPLMHTKYTASHLGISGVVLGLHDKDVAASVKAPAERIKGGTKDFDNLTKDEQDAITKALGNDQGTLWFVGKAGVTEAESWQYFAGSQLGTLSAYATVWHISPKQEILLKWIGESIEGCAEQAGKQGAASRGDLAEALKGFAQFKGKTLDEATMRGIGKHIENTLRISLPEKYRWEIK